MARVLIPFRDAETWRAYEVGDEYEGDRVAELAKGGYVEAERPAPKRQTRRPKAAPKE